jgi:hypothetical protein
MKKHLLIAAALLLAASQAEAGKSQSAYDDQAVSRKPEKTGPLLPEKCQSAVGAAASSSGNKETQAHPGQRNFDCQGSTGKVDPKFNRHNSQ